MKNSRLGWIDFSPEHRDRVRSVIDLLSTPGVVDELGVGIIRDSFADTLFPGISTIQTRPKYFLIVPRILRDYEQLPNDKREKQNVLEYLAEQELRCRIHLCRRYGSKQGLGIIGVKFGEQAERDVLRRPSSVYWNGLCLFKIIRSRQSLEEYSQRHSGHRPASSLVLQATKKEHGDDFDADDINTSPIVRLPEADNWQDNLAITLTKEEAEFLRKQIGVTCANTLLGKVLLNPEMLKEVALMPKNAEFRDLLQLPSIKALKTTGILRHIQLAAGFWDLLYGAHLRYNILLNQYRDQEKKIEYQKQWDEWVEKLKAFDWDGWSMDEIWQLVEQQGSKPKCWTRNFIEMWIDAVHRSAPDRVLNELVIRQESKNKLGRAKLRSVSKDVSASQWIGFKDLDYRLTQVRQLASDIYRAETEEADPNVGL